MSTDASTLRKRVSLRRWFPVLVLALALLAIAVLWAWPSPEYERMYRVAGTMISVEIAALLLLLWFVGFSGYSWLVRLGTIAALVLGALAFVREVQFTGDMVPIVHFRWNPSRDEVLEAARAARQDGAVVAPAALPAAGPEDYPEYRNRRRDGVVIGPPLARDWRTQPPRLVWRQPCGGGYASFAVVGGRAFTLEQRRDEEVVVCYDAATGREVWLHAYPAHFQEVLGGPGPRATPTVVDDAVYSLGATGRLVCLDAATGKLRWGVDILEDNANIAWAMAGSPLVYDNLVVVNPGTQQPSAAGRALVAFDRATGRLVWQAGSTRAGYCSPMLATLCGRRQVLLFDAEGLGGHDPATGAELWRHPWETYQGINVAQPLVLDGDRLFITSGYGVGCALLRLRETEGKLAVEEVYKKRTLRCRFTSPVLHRGHIYGLDEGILVCLDPETGERRWKEGRYGNGQLLLTHDLLVILSEQGKLALVEATPEAYRELASLPVLEGRTWNPLALAHGRAYVRNDHEMACYDLAAPAP